MKKTLCLTLASLMTLLLANTAQAAMFVGAIGAGIAGNSELGTVLAYCGGGIALVAIFAGVVTGNPTIVHIYLYMTLGVNGSFSHKEIASQLQDRYPFIENQEVVKELATKVKNAYEASDKNKAKEAYVSVAEKDVLEVLGKTDLTSQQIDLIVRELK